MTALELICLQLFISNCTLITIVIHLKKMGKPTIGKITKHEIDSKVSYTFEITKQ